MVEDVFEPRNLIFCHIKNGSSLIFIHSHSADIVNDVLGEELLEDTPHVGNRHEFLFEFDLNGDALLLSSEETSGLKGCLVVT